MCIRLSLDTDSHCTGYNADTDEEGDSLADSADAFPLYSTETLDTDSDGTGNNADTDDDGDSVAVSADAFPLESKEILDTDSVGAGNNVSLIHIYEHKRTERNSIAGYCLKKKKTQNTIQDREVR